MKLLRYGPAGEEKPGLLDADGRIRSLASVVPDITPEMLLKPRLAELAAIDCTRLPLVPGTPRLGTPVTGTRQFVAMGRNYLEHVREGNNPVPTEPAVFHKALTSISGPFDDIPLYPGSVALDYEGELAVVLGAPTHRITEAEALDCVAGYCICNDVSERDWQFKRGGLASKGKSAPGYGPLGPYLVTTDEVPDPQVLQIRTWVNGELRQNANTSAMIFTVAQFIAHLSEFMMLLPGDVLPTGTPEGVGWGEMNPRWLKPGDAVEIEITGLGRQRQIVRAVNY